MAMDFKTKAVETDPSTGLAVVNLKDVFKNVVGMPVDADTKHTRLPAIQPKNPDTEKQTVEHWAHAKQTPPWLFWAASHGKVWPHLYEITEKDYDAAIKAAGEVRLF